jgi:hypothetical protein
MQRYEIKQQAHFSRSLGKSKPSPSSELVEPNSIGSTVAKLAERVDGIEVKLTSLINVVRLVQRYTETKDDQYEKEKQGEIAASPCATNCAQMEIKLREFDQLSRQFREELRQVEKLKATCTFAPQPYLQDEEEEDEESLRELEQRLRHELDKKMEVCVNLIASNLEQKEGRVLADKVNEVSFSLNQLENECRRNKMMLEKELDTLAALIKETSTQLPAYSRLTEHELPSKSPPKLPLSKNSKSEKSISKGKQNRSAVAIAVNPKEVSKVREDELREALRKKKEHREKLKVKNW